MNLTVRPGKPLHGEAALPGDKSMSHRAALLAGMACGESVIENFLVSGVTRAMLRGLSALGVIWELERGTLHVSSQGMAAWKAPEAPIDCGNSATTLRLLAGALAAAGIPAVLDGSSGLRSRPMDRIVEPLRRMGVTIESAPGGCTPLRLGGRPAGQKLQAVDYTLPVASAQVKSCLLLAALAADGVMVLREPGPSRDHTERMLSGLGLQVSSEQPVEIDPKASAGGLYVTRLAPPSIFNLPPLNFSLPGDFSAAAFLIAGAAIAPGSSIRLAQVGLNPTRTGLLDALAAMGSELRLVGVTEICGEPAGELEIRYAPLRAGYIGGELVVRMIDEFPAFAAAAAFAQGTTVVQDAAELRNKESDRISALCLGLRGLGISAAEAADGFTIQGGMPVSGGIAEAQSDHRLAMALALIGLASSSPVTVTGSEIIDESFPGFADTLMALGADLSISENLLGATIHGP